MTSPPDTRSPVDQEQDQEISRRVAELQQAASIEQYQIRRAREMAAYAERLENDARARLVQIEGQLLELGAQSPVA